MKRNLLCILLMLAIPTICMSKERLILIGDACVAPHSIANPDVRGWGEILPKHLSKNVEVINYAQAGESTRTLVGKRIEKIIEQCNTGDFILIQLGQNDLREEYGNMYYSTSEMASQLQAIVQILKRENLEVILCTPLSQPFYKDGKPIRRMGAYPEVIRRVAQCEKTYLIDMEEITFEWLSEIGEQNAFLFFKNISSDTRRKEYLLTEAGATEISRMIADQFVKEKVKKLKKDVLPALVAK